jgi:hypothetical protein
MLPGEVNPVRNSSRCDSKPSGALDPAGIILESNPVAAAGPEGLSPSRKLARREQRGNISNGVNILSSVRSAAHLAGQSEALEFLTAKFSQKWQKALTSK